MIDTGVLIVGAGPAGLALANVLQANGVACAVVERRTHEALRTRPGGGLIEARTVELLDGYGLTDRLLACAPAHGECEFRTPEGSYLLRYGELAGSVGHYVYPQHELADDLRATFEGELHFSTPALQIHDGARAYVRCESLDVECDFVVGCDGYFGATRPAVERALTTVRRDHPAALLAVLAEVAPSTDHIVYGLHQHGFAGHMLRSPEISRFYLGVAPDEALERWSPRRIWDELRTRLARPGWTLSEGPILDRQIVAMTSLISEPMQHGRIFLAGDAAHLLTPAAGKGMNLAVQDAIDLGEAFARFYRGGDEAPLRGYSARRLPHVWEAQAFGSLMLSITTVPAPHVRGSFLERLDAVLGGSDDDALVRFARRYVGTAPVAAPPAGRRAVTT